MPSDPLTKQSSPKGKPIEVIRRGRLSIKNIREWTKGKSENDFSENSLLQSGVHRALMAVGEVIKHLPDAILSSEPEFLGRTSKFCKMSLPMTRGMVKKIVCRIAIKELFPLDAALTRLEQQLQQNPET